MFWKKLHVRFIKTILVFNQANRPFSTSKLFQKVGSNIECLSNNYSNFTIKTHCIDTTNLNITAIEGYTILNESSNKNKYVSKNGWLDSTGYVEYFSLENPNAFKTDFNAISNKNWILINSFYFSFEINYFNIHMNSIIALQINYEKLGLKYFPKVNINVMSIENITGIHGAATAFAVLTLLTNIYNILRSTPEKREIKEVLIAEYSPYVGNEVTYVSNENYCVYGFKKMYYNILYFFRYNFVTPNFFIFMSKHFY